MSKSSFFFGYGTCKEPEMIEAITGKKPEVVGDALLDGWELHIQDLTEVTNRWAHPKNILQKTWGDNFHSYVIIPKRGESVSGTLYKLSLPERKMIDNWEMVHQGWYKKVYVDVVGKDGKNYEATTQALRLPQEASQKADGQNYNPWLIPKTKLLKTAELIRNS